MEKAREPAIPVGLTQPARDDISIVLVRRAAVRRIHLFPQGGIDLGDSRLTGRNDPAVERPKMRPFVQLPIRIAQPRNTGVAGLCDRTLHIEMEHRLRLRALFALAPPVFARAGRRQIFTGKRGPIRQIDAQPRQAGGRRLRAEIVDADVAFEGGPSVSCFLS